MQYYAHRTDSEDPAGWQLLTKHLDGVADRAGRYAEKFGAGEWGRQAGLLHDFGKFSKEFQQRLKGSAIAVDHATAGAQYITKRWGNLSSRILSYVIAGHHAGLTDFGSETGDESCLAQRLQKVIYPYEAAASLLMPDAAGRPLPAPIQWGGHSGLQLSMFTRMLFSCLVDADSLDTEEYAEQRKTRLRDNQADFPALYAKYRNYMSSKFGEPDTPIKHERSALFHLCMEKAEQERGLYTLTLPTGSGKTLLSLGFALRHAVKHGLRRIVFVIPYTSIIEQNAAVYREVLGAEYVLEHHSNVQLERTLAEEAAAEWSPELKSRLELAEENWDFPIVVTTNVQLFESLYSNRRSRCRKLHNLSQSVIIVDEAQMMNGEFYKPSVFALEELVRNYGSTVVLSTATQPDSIALFKDAKMSPLPFREIVDDVAARFAPFERVQLRSMGSTDYEQLASKLTENRQALCIVNTRNAARKIYERVRVRVGSEAAFHLSARMCPKHRLAKLKVIRQRLMDGLPCLLISTQLIECGVDVDFPTVYRELAGLDSISQAAGRCNREGLLKTGYTYVFETDETPTRGWFGLTARIARSVLEEHSDRPLSQDAIRTYFRELYFYQALEKPVGSLKDATDKYGILDQLDERPPGRVELPFRSVAEQFQLINTPTRAVLIPWDKAAEEHLDSLLHAPTINSLLRKLQPYVVQLYPQEFQAFRQAGQIVEVRSDVFKLSNPEHWYDEEIGIKPFTEEHHQNELYVF
ncbi:CRISPR-associated helicase Cas3' [Cohnella sp. GCM10020058]|uniref:CRISPR-associated helicase Cas3' n=1 Tax=Cohnella sp. GCM10020058 TaxID=3317330 RepID=UPI00363CC9E4